MSIYTFSTDSRNFDNAEFAVISSRANNRVRRIGKMKNVKKYLSCFAFGIIFGLAYFTQFRVGTAAQALLDIVRYAIIVGGVLMFGSWYQTQAQGKRRKRVQRQLVERSFGQARFKHSADYHVVSSKKGHHALGRM